MDTNTPIDYDQSHEAHHETSITQGIKYLALSFLTVTGIVWVGNKLIRGARSNKAEKNTLNDGTAENVAKLIKMAFENDGWPGTDEEELRNQFTRMPSKAFFTEVAKAYQRLYSTATSKASLERDLQEELTSSELKEIMMIKEGKPEKTGGKPDAAQQHKAWARRLKAAFEKTYGGFPGTDEVAIRAVFNEIPSKAAWAQVKAAFAAEYHESLEESLKSELEFWEYSDYMKIINAKK